MKLIKLTRDRFACVDDEDFDWLSQWLWSYDRMKGNTGYAVRTDYMKQKKVYMHAAVMKRHGLWERRRQVDHINNCGCDNRKVNLRLATPGNQKANSGLRTNNTSGVVGVSWDKSTGGWRARIHVNGKDTYLGCYNDFEEAVKARRLAEIKYFGEFQHDPTKVCPLGYTGQCPECAARLRENNVR